MHILNNLKKLRLKKGLTQIELANLVGVSLNGYLRWEQGANSPSEENMIKLLKALDMEDLVNKKDK